MTRLLTLTVAILIFPLLLRADDKNQNAPSGTLNFTERSEQSTNEFIANRMGWPLNAEEAAKSDYKLPEESFEVYLPADYTGEKPFGLLVFCHPGPSGKPPRDYLDSIDKHHLIYCGPNNIGNNRFVRPRMGLALDAVPNMRKRYNIDPDRIYVTGISGGGRVASMLGVGFADVFRGGGLYIIGCNFYHEEKSAEQNGVFKRSYNVPPPKVFRAARETSKHVFLTGDTDGNREQTWLYYNGFKRDHFEHITYLQVPGMGHQHPNAEWFEKAMIALDEPLPKPGEKPKPAAAATTQPTPSAKPTPATTQANDPETIAQALLTNAKLYVTNKLPDRAREKLNWIITQYPKTRAATEARALLKTL